MRSRAIPSWLGMVAFLHDLVMAALSFVLALWLRLGTQSLLVQFTAREVMGMTALFTAVAGAVFLWQGLYRGVWRYASTSDLVAIARAALISVLIYLAILFLVSRLDAFPRSVLAIEWLVLVAMLGGPRLLYRLLREGRLDLEGARAAHLRARVLVLGAGDEAELFIRACGRGGAPYQPVGLLAVGNATVGREIHGVPVLGGLEDLDAAVARLKTAGRAPQRLVIAIPGMAGAPLRRLLDRADALGLTLARLPRMGALAAAGGERVEIAPVAVEDLLGRPQAVLDRASMQALIRGRRVLVTGAGGSIGAELARQLAAAEPARLVLLDASEFALYSIDLEIAERFANLPRRAVIADIRRRAALAALLAEERPELLFHAAALKHVPLVEDNPLEGLLTNAVGTRIVAEAAAAAGVALMVLISTDKAVNPESVMGGSKRLAEIWCQAHDLAGNTAGATRYVTVRFGNVLGSTGSVVPLFERQLKAGGPLTVTDPEVTRYFMTMREAVELVLQASALGMSSEGWRGRIFVLDMGEPVRIVDLARQMIRLAGLRPEIDVRIEFTGLRPGEKLAEELFHTAEPPLPTGAEGVLVAAVRARETGAVIAAFDELEAACRGLDRARALAVLRELVPEFRHQPQ